MCSHLVNNIHKNRSIGRDNTNTGTTVFSHTETLLWVEPNEKHRVIFVLMSCWLITVDMYLLMPYGVPNHMIPTMHREDIFLCRNLLSEWAFELCSYGKSKTPSENNSYNLKQCFDFQSLFRNQFQVQTHTALRAYFQRIVSKLYSYWRWAWGKGGGGNHVLCIVQMIKLAMVHSSACCKDSK